MGNDQAVAYAKVPTNIVKPPKKQPPSKEKTMYQVSLTSGDIQFHDDSSSHLPPLDANGDYHTHFSTSSSISVELLFHCEHGDIGPFPMNQLKANETRTFECNRTDIGNPKFCIVIMYREEKRSFPKWCIPNVTVHVIRQHEHVKKMYQHTSDLPGGDAVVYSITMAPYDTEITNKIKQKQNIDIVIDDGHIKYK